MLLKVPTEDPTFWLKHLKSPPKCTHLSMWKREVQFKIGNEGFFLEAGMVDVVALIVDGILPNGVDLEGFQPHVVLEEEFSN